MNENQDLDFSGRVVLVVGASRGGIGAAIARAFSARGAAVTITGVETQAVEADREFDYRQLDVRDQAAVTALAQNTPRLDVLINCAGISDRALPKTPDVFQTVLDINLTGSYRTCTAFLPQLKTARGAVVNIASMYSLFASPKVPAYGASKAGIAHLTRSLAAGWAEHGVRVNAIAPGFIVTEQSAPARADQQHYNNVIARTPAGRWGEPEDIVGAALFLASPLAGFITGAVLPVDGGYSVV